MSYVVLYIKEVKTFHARKRKRQKEIDEDYFLLHVWAVKANWSDSNYNVIPHKDIHIQRSCFYLHVLYMNIA